MNDADVKIIRPRSQILIDRDLVVEDIDVMAVDLDQELLLVKILQDIGVVRITAFKSQDGEHDVPKADAHWAEFEIGERTFAAPLGSNIGDPIGIGTDDVG